MFEYYGAVISARDDCTYELSKEIEMILSFYFYVDFLN